VKGVVRHPQIGNCVLLGAGATLLGAIRVGDSANIGACSMVGEDVPAYAVAVGVPAKIVKLKNSYVSSMLIDNKSENNNTKLIADSEKYLKVALSTELNNLDEAPSYTMDSTTLFYDI
jgi:serine acetyltransferase